MPHPKLNALEAPSAPFTILLLADPFPVLFMPLAGHAQRCVASQPCPTIWIGDNYLNNLLHQYSISSPSSRGRHSHLQRGSLSRSLSYQCQSIGHKPVYQQDHKPIGQQGRPLPNRQWFDYGGRQARYGSAVPGPMEARKRVAKRRMMNVANVAAGGSYDAGLAGMGGVGGLYWSEKDLTWKPPKQVERQVREEGRGLPDWLEKYEERKEEKLSEEVGNQTEAKISKGQVANTKELGPDSPLQKSLAGLALLSELERSNTIDQIRRIALQHNATIARNPITSGAAFRRLLQVGSPLSVLMEFLDDRALNAPKARNLQKLMNWSKLQQQPQKDIISLRSWIKRRIGIGPTSAYAIEQILRGVSRQYKVWSSVEGSRRFVSTIFNAVWAGVQASGANGLRDLGDISRDMLLKVGSELPDLQEAQLVIKAFLSSQKYHWSSMRRRILSIAARSSKSSQMISGDSIDRQGPSYSFAWFISILRDLPQFQATQIITSMSHDMVQRITEKVQGSLAITQQWFEALAPDIFNATRQESKNAKNWWFIERNLASQAPELLASYIRLLEDREKYIFILRYWFASRWPEADLRGMATWQSFVSRFELETVPGLGPDEMLLDVVQRLHKNYPNLLRSVLAEFYHLLRCLDQPGAIYSIAEYLKDCSFKFDSSVLAAQVTAFARNNSTMACNLFKLDSRLYFEDCAGFAEAYITNPPSSDRDILQFFDLLNQRQIKQRGRPSNIHLKLTPARVDLLHTMATAFAATTHLSPERAFHRVERCVKYFSGHYGLLRPEMSKALVKAGILRHLESGVWVNEGRLMWILDIVRTLEGEDVAVEVDRMARDWRERNRDKVEGGRGWG